jgi:RNA recognition motif-containing protein
MKNIYVGNLTFDATEDQVRGLFEAYGPVDKVSIVTDRDTGQPRGFAFVEMSDDESAGKAMEALNGTNLGGRNLTVNEARPKTDRPRGGGGGRGGFGGGGGRGSGGGGRGGRSGGGSWGR